MPESSSPTSPVPTPSQTQSTPTAIEQVRSLLQHILRVSIRDGRVFVGTFVGTDKPLNIILINADEYRSSQSGESGRYVGQIMIPWRLILKVEARGGGHGANEPNSKTLAKKVENIYL
jgi:small nuclear ribonucleoprotein (snRNP)-like protein